MNTSTTNCLAVVFVAFLAGLAAFILSILNVFTFDLIPNVMFLIAIVAFVLYAVFFHALVHTEKNRLVRDAVCCCGKLTIIGFIGSIVFALMAVLLFNTAIKVLFDLAVGFTFLFLMMFLAGMGCVITTIYQCTKNNCQ